MIVKGGNGLSIVKLAALLLLVISFAYGCSNSKQEVTDTVKNLLKAAHEKNSDQVRRYVDFDAMLDRSLKEQGIANLDTDRRKGIIDGLVESTCQLSKEDYSRALQTLKVEIGQDGHLAAAVYSTLGRMNVTLTLEKRQTGWVVTAIQ